MRLSVRDTGVGIAAADIPKIMESFGQADNTRAGVTEGTGLGLPHVKAIYEPWPRSSLSLPARAHLVPGDLRAHT